MMTTKKYKYDFIEKIEARAERIGEARGEARAQVRAEIRGEARGKAEALATFLRAQGIKLSPEQEKLIESCLDLNQLDMWIHRAATAGSADHVFLD